MWAFLISSVRLGACGAERASESWINPHSGPGPGTGEPTWDSNPACGPYVASQYGEFRVTDTNLLGQTVISNREFDSSGQPIGAEEDENHELIKVQALTFYSRDFTPWGTVATDGYDTNGLIADGLGYSNWYVTEGDVVVGGETIEGFVEIEEPYTGPMIYFNGGSSSGAPVMAETPPPCDEDAYRELLDILREVMSVVQDATRVANKMREKWGAQTGAKGAWNEFMRGASSKAVGELLPALGALQAAEHAKMSVLKAMKAVLDNCPQLKSELASIDRLIQRTRASMTARADAIQALNERQVGDEILFDFLELAVDEGIATLLGAGLVRGLGRLGGLVQKSNGFSKRADIPGGKQGKVPDGAGGEAPKWTSDDPHVAELANAIEDAHPGHVKGVNAKVDGHEVDIELENAVVEVKNKPKGLTSQVEARQEIGKPVIGHSPNMGPHAANSINNAGGIASGGVAGSVQDLIDVVAPD